MGETFDTLVVKDQGSKSSWCDCFILFPESCSAKPRFVVTLHMFKARPIAYINVQHTSTKYQHKIRAIWGCTSGQVASEVSTAVSTWPRMRRNRSEAWKMWIEWRFNCEKIGFRGDIMGISADPFLWPRRGGAWDHSFSPLCQGSRNCCSCSLKIFLYITAARHVSPTPENPRCSFRLSHRFRNCRLAHFSPKTVAAASAPCAKGCETVAALGFLLLPRLATDTPLPALLKKRVGGTGVSPFYNGILLGGAGLEDKIGEFTSINWTYLAYIPRKGWDKRDKSDNYHFEFESSFLVQGFVSVKFEASIPKIGQVENSGCQWARETLFGNGLKSEIGLQYQVSIEFWPAAKNDFGVACSMTA